MKKIMVRTTVVAVVACLLLSVWFVFQPPNKVHAATSVTVSTFDDLVWYCNEPGDYVITLGANITVTNKITVENGSKTIKGNGKTIRGVSGEPVFEIANGATITSENITIDRSAVPTSYIFFGLPGSKIVINSGKYINGGYMYGDTTCKCLIVSL